MTNKIEQKYILLSSIFLVNLSSYAMDKSPHPLETKRMEELDYRSYHLDIAVDITKKPAISRIVSQYLLNAPPGEAQLIIGAGKTGTFSLAPHAPYRRDYSYTVDILPHMEPDAVLDATNPEHLAYFPTNSFNSVIIDFSPLLTDANIHDFFRILAPGGKLIVKAGANSGWPAPDMIGKVKRPNTYWVSDDGRSGFITFTGWGGIEAFKKAALINANSYFKQHGFSSVSLHGDNVLVMTRSMKPYLDKKLSNKSSHTTTEGCVAKKILDAIQEDRGPGSDEMELSSSLFPTNEIEFSLGLEQPALRINKQISWVIYRSTLDLVNIPHLFGADKPELTENFEQKIETLRTEIDSIRLQLNDLKPLVLLPALPLFFTKEDKANPIHMSLSISSGCYERYERGRIERDERIRSNQMDQHKLTQDIQSLKRAIADKNNEIYTLYHRMNKEHEAVYFPDFGNITFQQLKNLKETAQALHNALDKKLAHPDSLQPDIMRLIANISKQITDIGHANLAAIIRKNPPDKELEFVINCDKNL